MEHKEEEPKEKMLGKFVCFILMITTIEVLSQEENENVRKETLNLIVGIKKVVKLNFEADFVNLLRINNVADKLDMKPVQGINEIIFEGKTPGSTNVIIKDKIGQTRLEYNVVITETDQSKMVKDLRELVGDIEGVEIGIRAGRVVVDGEVIVPKKIGRLVVALEKYPDVIVFLEPSPHTMELIAKKMQDEIQLSGIKDVTVRVVNDSFWLEGVVNDKNNKKIRALNIATALLPDRIASLAQRTGAVGGASAQKILIKNFIEEKVAEKDKPIPKLIKISSQFVELSKDYARTFGFRWAPLFTGGGGAVTVGASEAGTISSSSTDGALTAAISNLFPKLTAARTAGSARVIQSGMVITEDNVQVSIGKSTAIPFESGSGEFSRGQQAEARFTITTTPQILKEENIKLGGLKISVSIITGQTNDGKPLQTTNEVATSLIVGSKESAVVGGVFQAQSTTAYDKFPGGAPNQGEDYLFNFVRAKDHKETKNQFVVFVTPEIIDSASKGVDQIKRKFRRRSR